MEWYYNFNGQRTGPVSDGELEQMAVSGVVRPETLVWHAGLPDWAPFASVGFAGPAGALPLSGSAFPAAFPGGRHYAGFWIRFVAIVIDGIILSIAGAIVGLPFGMYSMGIPHDFPDVGPSFVGTMVLVRVIGLAIAIGYYAFFLTKYGGTPGKLALGLRVISADGGPVSLGQAIARYFCYWLDTVILLIGFIIAAFDSEKRALHDMICSTRVIYKR
jgi:uncharacterized RDD family membrane protein YckC